jgi:glycosyltransferase involved in cell wall biosynthesis
MRVLQLTQRFPPALGGVEDHVFHLASRLCEAGVDVEVATTDLLREVPIQRFEGPEPQLPFRVTRYRARRLFDAPHGLGIWAPAMVRAALMKHADVVHAHAYGRFPTWAGSLTRALNGASLVVTSHSDPGRPSVAKRLFDETVPFLTLRRADRVIAVTRLEASQLESFGVSRQRIHVIPNAIDLTEFRDIPVRRPGSDGVTGLYVGRLDPEQKGLTTLVRACALLPASFNIRFRLVGEDWGATTQLRALASRLGVLNRFQFLGRVSRADLLHEYGNADFLVLPSIFEPFGIVLLEAMAAGVPIVASKVGGIPEVIGEHAGILTGPGDASQLAEAISRLAESPSLRVQLAASGRERVQAFSWDAIFPRILQVYRDAVDDRKA